MIYQLGKISGLKDSREIRDWARKNWNLLFVEEKVFMPDVWKLIPIMHESNMITFWAHPWKALFRNKNEKKESIDTLENIVSSGIDWIEVFSHSHTNEQTKYFLNQSKIRSLLISWWWDYHGLNEGKISYPLFADYIPAFLKKLWEY